MKIVRPKPRVILALSVIAASAIVALKALSLSISYTPFPFDHNDDGNAAFVGDNKDQHQTALAGLAGDSKNEHVAGLAAEVHGKLPKSIDYHKSKDTFQEPEKKRVEEAKSDEESGRLQLVRAEERVHRPVQESVKISGDKPKPGGDPEQVLGETQIAPPPASVAVDKQNYKNEVTSRADQAKRKPYRPLINSTGYPKLYNSRFVPSRQIVHLDLKGAPPKVHYFEEFFRLISRLGATGILIEWEDMFPYTGELADCRNGNAYSETDVKLILRWAKESDLEVIPLVQTFGHLEWVLKHEKFAHLREVQRYAQVICLSNPEAVNLVKTIVDQVLSMHQKHDNGSFFHMGADEAFQVGQCDRCRKAIDQKYSGSPDGLMLHHIETVAKYVKEKYGRRVLMWHDMLDHVQLSELTNSRIGQHVEPVVWAYAEQVPQYIRPDLWKKFSLAFPFIWSASAFKGADGPDRFHSNPLHYMRNHFGWSQSMTDHYMKFKEFRGIILTGWQRYDHFAILCELLPVGIPSLALNLQIVQHGGQFGEEVQRKTSKILGCESINVNSPGIAASNCRFPGYEIYKQIQLLKQIGDNGLLKDNALLGWLSPFNIRHKYSSAWYLDQIQRKLELSTNSFLASAMNLRKELAKVFYNDTVDEFLLEYVEPTARKWVELRDSAKEIGQLRTFPARPFQIKLMSELGPTDTSTATKATRTAGSV